MSSYFLTARNHPKYEKGILDLCSCKELEFYGQFALRMQYIETSRIPTTGVTVKGGRLVCYYNTEFLNKHSQGVANFILIHEVQHILLNHVGYMGNSRFNEDESHKLQNIAADMVINTGIQGMVHSSSFVANLLEVPKEGYFLPEEYEGDQLFEPVYEWLKENPPEEEGKDLLDDHEIGEGELADLADANAQEIMDTLVDSALQTMRSQGYVSASDERMLERLRKRKNNWLSKLKQAVTVAKGIGQKRKTIRRPHRMKVHGLKGKIKTQQSIGVVLDVSGSMHGEIEKVLGTLLGKGLHIDLIQADTEIKKVETITSDKDLQQMSLVGFGGTLLQPALDFYKKSFASTPLVIMTDGYCDNLNLTGIKNTIFLTTGVVPDIIGKHTVVRIED